MLAYAFFFHSDSEQFQPVLLKSLMCKCFLYKAILSMIIFINNVTSLKPTVTEVHKAAV